ncbi:MAG: DUF4013 domain-containing protein [Chloroflexi bacterium]|nr:DUF4013 domain-containing protein [Chloroflexota bacterium]
MDLRTAATTIHSDPLWWRKTLIGGALLMSIVGAPFAGGWIVESIDNSRKGFPTPLPPWFDWWSRWLIGMFAGLIDFLFYGMPFLVAVVVFFCVAFSSVIGGSPELANRVLGVLAVVMSAYIVLVFISGVSIVGRLIYVQDASPEHAMSVRAMREALRPGARGVYFRARLASLPAYLPAVLLGALAYLAASRLTVPGTWLIILLLVWLTLSAVLYAHLIVAQIYVAAERELDRRGLTRVSELI